MGFGKLSKVTDVMNKADSLTSQAKSIYSDPMSVAETVAGNVAQQYVGGYVGAAKNAFSAVTDVQGLISNPRDTIMNAGTSLADGYLGAYTGGLVDTGTITGLFDGSTNPRDSIMNAGTGIADSYLGAYTGGLVDTGTITGLFDGSTIGNVQNAFGGITDSFSSMFGGDSSANMAGVASEWINPDISLFEEGGMDLGFTETDILGTDLNPLHIKADKKKKKKGRRKKPVDQPKGAWDTGNKTGKFNINTIVGHVKDNPLLEPNRFEVIITSAKLDLGQYERDIMFNCHRCDIPGHNVGSFDHSIVGPKRKIPNEEIFDDLSMTFYNNHNLDEMKYMNRWMKMIGGNDTWRLAYYNDIVADITINIYDLRENLTSEVRIFEAYPIGYSEVEFSYAGELPSEITVNWAYHSYEIQSKGGH
ncbi:MAG: hypothetical protein DRQ78_08570 [Epsilonproteobacteria bacterium]|nr:MAG: hypothetical protein DRQ78_08570 [Campylobacterota bacterium]